MKDFFDEYGPSFLGLQIQRLYYEIEKGSTAIFVAEPSGNLLPRHASLLIFLKHRGPSSGKELADALSISHQLVSQRIVALKKAGLIKSVDNPKDRRCVQNKLTPAGRKAANAIESACKDADEAYDGLFDEIGGDLLATVIRARQALAERSLDVRIRDAKLALRPKTR